MAYAAFFGIAFTYAVRVNLSVAIVCMVRMPNVSTVDVGNSSSPCGEMDGDITSFNEVYVVYDTVHNVLVKVLF